MYIGKLKLAGEAELLRPGTEKPMTATIDSEGRFAFSWTDLYDTGVDCRVKLDQSAFVGAVTLPLTADSGVEFVEIYADGVLAGRKDAATGKTFGGVVTVAVGCVADVITVRMKANLKKIVFATPELLGAVCDGAPLVWPTPKSMVMGEGKVKIAKIECGEDADEAAAAEFLRSRIAERFGDIYDEGGVSVKIALGERTDFGDDRYSLVIGKDGILISAGSRIALMYAADTLTKLCDEGEFPVVTVEDGPDKPIRGFHFGLPPRDQLDFMKRVFRYVLLPLRYNQIYIEFCGAMRFDSHPEISEAWVNGNERARAGLQPPFPHAMMGANGTLLEKDEVRDLLDCARELGFEIIPEVQSFGHVQYITFAHPELAEREEEDKDVNDTRAEDERPHNFYSHCYCPSKEESYKLIFDLIDEIVEVARPQRYVHIGHDEVYHIGLCPLCKDKSHAELFAYHVNRLYEHITKKGYKVVMWSDMIQSATAYQTPPAADMIPKDILCLDFVWYFHLDLDIEDNLLEKGFKVAVGNLYSSHYPRYESRMAKDGMLGGEVSTWCVANEYFFGKKGKFWDLAMTAEMLWRFEGYDGRLRPVYNEIISKKVQPLLRDEVRGVYSIGGYDGYSVAPVGESAGVPEDVMAVCPESVIAESASVKIGATCDRLVFKHTTVRNMPRIQWQPLLHCGKYAVRYADGECVEIPVDYAGNVVAYDRRYAEPMPGGYARHNGYIGTWVYDPIYEGFTKNGRPMHICGFVWENPRADVAIDSISYVADAEDYSTLVLCGVDVMRKK